MGHLLLVLDLGPESILPILQPFPLATLTQEVGKGYSGDVWGEGVVWTGAGREMETYGQSCSRLQ